MGQTELFNNLLMIIIIDINYLKSFSYEQILYNVVGKRSRG